MTISIFIFSHAYHLFCCRFPMETSYHVKHQISDWMVVLDQKKRLVPVWSCTVIARKGTGVARHPSALAHTWHTTGTHLARHEPAPARHRHASDLLAYRAEISNTASNSTHITLVTLWIFQNIDLYRSHSKIKFLMKIFKTLFVFLFYHLFK